MNRSVEIYMIIAITLMTITLGLPHNCLQYCKFSPRYFIPRPECDCSYHDLQQNVSTLSNLTSNIQESAQTNGPNNTLVGQNSYDKNYGMRSNKYKRGDDYFQHEAKEVPLHLYLDLDIDTSDNSNGSQLEELKNIFVNFQAAEKDLSECVNIHIYIFSKHIDNKTNTNKSGEDHNDDSLSSQELTEIENKCNQSSTIIKKSIYQIQQFVSRGSLNPNRGDDTKETVTDVVNKDMTLNESYESADSTTVSAEYNTARTYLTGMLNKVTQDATEFITENHNDNVLNNNDLSLKKNEDITLTFSAYNDPIVHTRANFATNADFTSKVNDYEDLEATIAMNRRMYSDSDMKIPKIITKELANGTVLSVVDGYEEITNSGFITSSTFSITANDISMPTTLGTFNETTTEQEGLIPKTNIDNLVQSDLVEIHGNLYFMFGSKRIPARFIQQSDGELNVAIDGYSICNQMLQENTSILMSLLCNCIKLQKCKYTSH